MSVFSFSVRRRLTLGLLLFLAASEPTFAHEPAKVVMYPATKIYAEKGFEVPEMENGAIAVLNDELISLDEYKAWLNKKIGYSPAARVYYFTSHAMNEFFAERDFDLEALRRSLLENVYRYEMLERVYTSVDLWRDEYAEYELETVNLTKEDRLRAAERTKAYLYQTAFLMEMWDELLETVLSEQRLDPDSLSVEVDDPLLKSQIRENNAYFMAKRAMVILDKEIRGIALAEGDLQAIDKKAYQDWIFDEYQSPLFTENYLAMRLVWGRAEAEGVTVADEAVQNLYEQRMEAYQKELDMLNVLLPEDCEPMAVDPEYAEYVKWECRVDLLGSYMYRASNPLKEHEIAKLFYDEYGFNGERCNVSEIFKWVRKRRISGDVPERQAELELEEMARAQSELVDIQRRIKEVGVEKLPLFAMTENQKTVDQKNFGHVAVPEDKFDDVSLTMLSQLAENEMTDVFESGGIGLHLVWLMERTDKGPQYYQIFRPLFGRSGYNLEVFEKEREMDRSELERLKALVQKGEPIEDLAKEHSDSFNKYGANISDNYQRSYGYGFAEELSTMQEGEMKILQTPKGIHLVQFHSREVTELTEEIEAGYVNEYLSVRATDDELNDLSKILLYEANPYFQDE